MTKHKTPESTATIVAVGGKTLPNPVPMDSPEATEHITNAIKAAAGHTKRTKDVTETLKHVLTDAEKLALGQKLAEANIEAEGAEAEKKSVTATLKAKCEGCIAKVSEISNRLSAGYEYRPVVCRVTFDDPEHGQKTTRRADNGETVKTEAMTLAEMQQRLPGFEEAAGD